MTVSVELLNWNSCAVGLDHFAYRLSANGTAVRATRAAHAEYSVSTLNEEGIHLLRVAKQAELA